MCHNLIRFNQSGNKSVNEMMILLTGVKNQKTETGISNKHHKFIPMFAIIERDRLKYTAKGGVPAT